MDESEVLAKVSEENVEFIRLWFTDLAGSLKGFMVPRDELEKGFEEGFGFDGSSIEGFSRIQESDMLAQPDPETFALLPWTAEDSDEPPVGMMFCDILSHDGTPYGVDPRYILKQSLEDAREMGFDQYFTGPEMEYFYFESPDSTKLIDHGGYFDLTAMDLPNDLRKETIMALGDMGIDVPYSHHEVAPSQHEINLHHSEALRMADITIIYRYVVKEVANRNGVHATFMPKPLEEENGSGMHVHLSLYKDGENAFFDPSARFNLSETARQFIAGILEHIKEITAVTNQWPNSYKRLIPGYEAPVYLSWGQSNRSALLRVPANRKGEEGATRVELRSPDPAANPYLTFAVMLQAGLEGIREGYELEPPTTDNIYEMAPQERHKAGIESLPGSLGEAIYHFENSDLMKEVFGEEAFDNYVREKRYVWDQYRQHVSQYELDEYLPVL
ncbi:MAG: glutamine synthetase family protein [bacterium]